MTRTLSTLLAAVMLLSAALPAAGKKKQVIGYYPSWQLTKRNMLVTTCALPYEKYTIINFAFLYPQPDGRIRGLDSLRMEDAAILRGDTDRVNAGYAASTSLSARAHEHGTKVMVSVGGWEGSNEFSGIAADPVKRAVFAQSCIDLVREYGLDGIDIDWEFPGYAEHHGGPGDKRNFTVLMQQIRDSLTAHGRSTGAQYLLTAALAAGGEHVGNLELAALAGILDYLNIMTYDMSGDWSPVSAHHTPLYSRPSVPGDQSLDASFNVYHGVHGVPANKINLGAAFYAHTFANCTALYGTHTGSDRVHCGPEGFFYHQIMRNITDFERRWDDTAKAPYLIGQRYNTVVSYDDERSVALKAQYVIDHDAAGLIIWEATGDYMDDGTTPLLDAVYRTFKTHNETHAK